MDIFWGDVLYMEKKKKKTLVPSSNIFRQTEAQMSASNVQVSIDVTRLSPKAACDALSDVIRDEGRGGDICCTRR